MARPARKARSAPRRSGTIGGTTRFLLLIVLAALLLRSFIVAPFSIPSESMLPELEVGDYLIVAKWPYGWSRYSLPLSIPAFRGRILGAAPARGDVVVFKNPGNVRTDYIKRVIGLPGDRVAVRGGRLVLNGSIVPRVRVADLLVPVSPNSPCRPAPGLAVTLERDEEAGAICRYPRYRETLAGGREYDVIDLGHVAADDTREFRVPAGHYFMLGDNRDRSADSRFPAAADGGTGFVPAENLVGRAASLVFSTDGTAAWTKPWTWWNATRRDRIGAAL
ncbi:MAG: signal peptidase [Sphingomonas bacterium]|nr:signal peptidase [Sphingomonas bacterium]